KRPQFSSQTCCSAFYSIWPIVDSCDVRLAIQAQRMNPHEQLRSDLPKHDRARWRVLLGIMYTVLKCYPICSQVRLPQIAPQTRSPALEPFVTAANLVQ